ncbi:MAG TPA: EAL domain-containing protein [Candidatus Sumerlaeota bacterium]|nr:EAL domain-containing protein [Candidatus Sumerlaeota bacterium]
MHWAGRIDQIIQQNGLYLRCQKVEPLDPASGHVPYYEILLGIRPDNEEIPTPKFLSAVERWQRGTDVDMWVVEKTFAWVENNPEWFERIGGFAINIVPASMAHPEFLKFLHAKLDTAALPLDKITFEITETSAIDNQRAAQEFIRQIRRYGCRFSVDDLGSGYSSFAHLRNLRTDSIKIDGIFVKDCVDTPSDFAMVRSMNDIGHALGLATVAEFVESVEIMEKLREIGVDYVQGYAVKKPLRLEELIPYLEQEKRKEAERMQEASESEDRQPDAAAASHYTWRNESRTSRTRSDLHRE